MRKVLQLLCIAGIIVIPVLIQSCGECTKKVPCPGYKDDLTEQWLPYYHGTLAKFNSQGQQPAVFTFDSLFATQPYSIESRSPVCDAEKIMVTKERLSTGEPTFRIEMQRMELMDRGRTERRVVLKLLGTSIYCEGLSEDGFAQVTSQSGNVVVQNLKYTVLDGKTFSNVQSMTFDTSVIKPTIYKLYLSKGIGMVGYETFSPIRLWVKE